MAPVMRPQKGYYSVVQYCPDLSRLEAANIGVVLFCPESGFLKAATSSNNRRIIRFFGSAGHDWKRISTVKKGLADRLEKERGSIQTLEQWQQFIATRANVLQITAPRPMKVTDPEKDLAELFEQVLGHPLKPKAKRDFRKHVGRELLAAGLERKIVSDVVVDVPVLGKPVEIPYGFQNGRFNLIAPVRFGGSHRSNHSERRAGMPSRGGRSISIPTRREGICSSSWWVSFGRRTASRDRSSGGR